MNRNWAILLTVLFAVCSSETVYAEDNRFVIGTSVNLREQACFDSKVIATLPIATEVAVNQKNNQWIHATVQSGLHKGRRGWIAAGFLVSERPTVESLLAEYDRVPVDDVDARLRWAERAIALDPSRSDALERIEKETARRIAAKFNDPWPPVSLREGFVGSGSSITFSSDRLAASSTDQAVTVRATQVHSSGKWYFEAKLKRGRGIMDGINTVGIESTSIESKVLMADRSNYPYKSNTTVGYFVVGWPTWPKIEDGDVFGIAMDLDNHKLYAHRNGFWGFDAPPSSGNGQRIVPNRHYAATSLLGRNFEKRPGNPTNDPNTWILNFGATPFQYPIPKGYYSYDGNQIAEK